MDLESSGTHFSLQLQQQITFPLGETTDQASHRGFLRFVCHLLIEQLPEIALEPAKESLVEIRDFYFVKGVKNDFAQSVSLLDRPEIRARVEEPFERPAYPIVDE